MHRTLFVIAVSMAMALAQAGHSFAQDFVQVIETESSPLDNRVTTVILDADLTPRSYAITIKPYTRVVDNHAEIVARRGTESFESRYRRSMATRRAIYDLYYRLGH